MEELSYFKEEAKSNKDIIALCKKYPFFIQWVPLSNILRIFPSDTIALHKIGRYNSFTSIAGTPVLVVPNNCTPVLAGIAGANIHANNFTGVYCSESKFSRIRWYAYASLDDILQDLFFIILKG